MRTLPGHGDRAADDLDVFVCYRREDSAGHAGRLADRLTAEFGEAHVFVDVESIEPGVDFTAAAADAIASCDAIVIVIGRRWLAAADAGGARRLDDSADYVHQEIVAGFRAGVRVIPVLVQGAAMPGPADLPGDLRPLATRNAIEVSETRWAYDVGRLIETLRNIPGHRAEARPLPELALELVPRASTGFRRARHSVHVRNDGPETVAAELAPATREPDLDLRVAPHTVRAEPGARKIATIVVRPRHVNRSSHSRTRRFRVLVASGGEHAVLDGEMRQRSSLPLWAAASVIFLAAGVLAWSGLRPGPTPFHAVQVERAAQRITVSPVAANGTVFAGEADGGLQWFGSTKGRIPTALGYVRRIVLLRTTLVVEGDDRVAAFDVSVRPPALLWTAPGGMVASASETRWDAYVYVASNDGVVRAFQAGTGNPYWPQTLVGATIDGPPVVAQGKLYVGLDSGVVDVLSPDTGAVVGRLRPLPPRVRPRTPIIIKQGALYWPGSDHTVHAILLDGATRWSATTSGRLTLPAVQSKTLFVGSSLGSTGETLYAFNARSSKELWSAHIDGPLIAPPLPMVSVGTVVVASGNKLLAFRIADGHLLGSVTLSGAATAPPANCDGFVCVPTADRSITAYRVSST